MDPLRDHRSGGRIIPGPANAEPMLITQTKVDAGSGEAILDFIDESTRILQEAGMEPRYIVVGTVAYEALRQAMAQRFGRSAGTFESYQWLSVVVDPFRGQEVCVLPPPSIVAEGVDAEQR
jgi:hypothetical protein